MNLKAVTALTQAKGLIDTPEKWGKKAFAWQGKMCLMTAVMDASKKDSKAQADSILFLKEAWGDVPGIKILTSYNDTHTHDEVMKLFDDAIVLASASDKVEVK